MTEAALVCPAGHGGQPPGGAFCAECGTRLWHEPLVGAEYVLIAAGALDDASWAIPTSPIA